MVEIGPNLEKLLLGNPSRFWEKIDMHGPDDCWLWQAHCTAQGYGVIMVGSRKDGTRRTVRAHRLAYELAVGPILAGLCVLHNCDNPTCVNPSHLYAGTQRDNMRDCYARGRQGERPRGENHGRAKLTDEDVLAIRTDSRTQVVISADYDIGPAEVGRIKRRKTWAHVQGTR